MSPTLVSWIAISYIYIYIIIIWHTLFHIFLVLWFSAIAAGRMRNVSKIFVQLGFSDSQSPWAWMTTIMKDSQKKCWSVCTFVWKGNSCVSAATFELGNWKVYRARAIKHPVVWKGSAYWIYRRWQRFCFMLMCDNVLLLFPKMPQVRTMHAWLCSDLACVYNS